MSRKFAVGIAVSATVLSGCGSSEDGEGGGSGSGSSSEGPITIGATASLTGPFAATGTSMSYGYQLAVDQINADGGVLGRQLELDIQDDQSDAAVVTRLYTEFLGTDAVDAVLSPYGSALAGPAAQLAERYQTPMAHSQTSSPAVFQDTQWSVMAGITPGLTVFAGLPDFAVENDVPRITLVNNDLDAFTAICGGVADAIDEAGAELVAEIEYAASTSDFSSTALRIAEGDPDLVLGCSTAQDAIGLTRALDQAGFRPEALIYPTSSDPAFAEAVGPLAEGVMGYAEFNLALGYDGAQEFADGLQETYDVPVNSTAAGAYATVQVLAAAIEEAGSTDKADVAEALRGGSFDTIIGTYSVDDQGVQTGYEPLFFQYQDGEQAVVYPSDLTGAVAAQLPY